MVLMGGNALSPRGAAAEDSPPTPAVVPSHKVPSDREPKGWSRISLPEGPRSVPKQIAAALTFLANGGYEEAALSAVKFIQRLTAAGGAENDGGAWIFNARIIAARAFLEAGRPSESLRVLKKVNQEKKSVLRELRPHLLLLEARALEALGRHRMAARKYESVPASGRVAGMARARAARAWFAVGDCGRGGKKAADLRTHHPRHPDLPKLLYRRARCLEKEGRPGESVPIYYEIWLRHPIDEAARNSEMRLAHLRKRGFKSPRPSTQELLTRARKLQKARKIAEAARAWRVLSERAIPKSLSITVGFHLGLDAYFLRRNRDAAERLRWAASEGRGGRWAPKALYYLARTYLRRDDLKDFHKVGDELLRDYPRNAWARQFLYLRARIVEDNGHLGKALRLYQELANRHPVTRQGDLARWRVGWIHYWNGRDAQAEKSLSRLARDRAGSAVVQAARYWAGRAAERAGRPVAKTYYRLTRDADPASYYGQLGALRLGVALKQDGREISGPSRFPGPPTWNRVSRSVAEEAGRLFLAGLFRPAADALQGPGLESRYFLYQRARFLHLARDHGEALRILERFAFRRARLGIGPPPREFWRILYPFDRRALRYAEGNGSRNPVDPLLVSAIARAESLFDPKGISTAGARGLMQLMPKTARRLARRLNLPEPSPEDLFHPDLNIRLGSAFLGSLVARFGGNPVPAVAAYNAGFNAARRWWKANGHLDEASFIALIPYRETRRYTRRVMAYYRWYQVIYGADPLKPSRRGGGKGRP